LDAWCSSSEAIAVARIFTSAFFLLFGEYKVFGSEFTHRGSPVWEFRCGATSAQNSTTCPCCFCS